MSKKHYARQRLQRWDKVQLMDETADVEEEIEDVKKRVYTICVTPSSVTSAHTPAATKAALPTASSAKFVL